MVYESALKHIWDFSNNLTSENHTKRLLKSYYINTCRAILKDNNAPYVGEMCAHCALFWSESEYSLKLIPQVKSTKTSKAKRLISKLEAAEKSQVPGLLTKKQKKRAKWLKKRAKSQLQIHCKFCQHKSTLPLEKPKKITKNENTICEETIKPIKKKKRKDKTAGLKIPAVATPQITLDKGIKNLTRPTTVVKSNQPTKLQSKPSNKSAKLNQGKKLAKSKTQQQNALLQLADMLKKQSSSNKSTLSNSLNALIK